MFSAVTLRTLALLRTNATVNTVAPARGHGGYTQGAHLRMFPHMCDLLAQMSDEAALLLHEHEVAV